MAYNKNELLQLPLEERKALASELEDSILADDLQATPDWKIQLIKERIAVDEQHPEEGIDWNILRKKYLN